VRGYTVYREASVVKQAYRQTKVKSLKGAKAISTRKRKAASNCSDAAFESEA
jgi:hypothetical protein